MKYTVIFCIGLVLAVLVIGCTQPNTPAPPQGNTQGTTQVVSQADLVSDAQLSALDTELSATDSSLDDLNAIGDVDVQAISTSDFS